MAKIWSTLGARATGPRLSRMQQSPQFRGGRFHNALPTQQASLLHMLQRWLFEKPPHREPAGPVPILPRTAADFVRPAATLQITWFGHASVLVELEGRRLLVDPVWGDHASPGRLFGVKRFFPPPLELDDLPPLDAVLLSHDHYDHLNTPTIRALRDRVPRFITTLGVGAHLEAWGVPAGNIEELDWWEETTVGEVRLVHTPTRHFSGRSLKDRDAKLWGGWAFLGATQRAYFSGDSGMFPGFEEVGERLGPFDITMMEAGAYNSDWPDIHLGPEQAVAAHQMARGNLMIPVHWGTFALAFHGWTEPVERVLAAAENAGVAISTPRPGESVSVSSHPGINRWWPSLPWQTAEEAPIVSTGL